MLSHSSSELDVNEQSAVIQQGTVYRKTVGHYLVCAAGQMVDCELSSRLRKQLIYPIAAPSSLHQRVVAVADIRQLDPVAIGDEVQFMAAGQGKGLIMAVLPRRTALTRRAAGKKPLAQVIMANIDQVVAVIAAAQPAPWWESLDRYLAAAEQAELPVTICITKAELVDSAWLATEAAVYERLGYPVLITSSVAERGIDEVKAVLQGKLSALMGNSGVGKSSLLNAVQPELGLRVNAVSRRGGQGKHTTTHLELFGLTFGGQVVDTPGMREFGLWEVGPRELADLFRELAPLVDACRFGVDCSHRHEPGCAIKAAVAQGTIATRRYQSYLAMREGL